jgi:hypothetical protein
MQLRYFVNGLPDNSLQRFLISGTTQLKIDSNYMASSTDKAGLHEKFCTTTFSLRNGNSSVFLILVDSPALSGVKSSSERRFKPDLRDRSSMRSSK